MRANYIDCCDSITGLQGLPDNCIDCCVTSPPYYGLRDYGVAGQIGQEQTPEEYVSNLISVFAEVRRVLRPGGTLWVNIGDSYAGSGKGRKADGTHQEGGKQGTNKGTILGTLHKTTTSSAKAKDLIGIPWMLAFALRADGWYLRQDIIWQKPNCMPESVKDRCTKSHEYIFLLSKSPKYYFDAEAISEPIVGKSTKRYMENKENPPVFGGEKYGANDAEETRTKSGNVYVPTPRRNKRDVWSVSTASYKGAHFAVFPEKLIEPCILAGAPKGGIVLDPFMGSGTTAAICLRTGRQYIGFEINEEYCEIARQRVKEAIQC